MSLVKIRRNAQITLPADVRQKLRVEEGDLLEAEVVESGLLLKPVSVVERDKARAAAFEAMDATRYIGPGPEPTEDEVMDTVLEEIKATRQNDAKSRNR